ncbi:MAG: NADH-quinone oxidoreductase subunit M, partial [Actinobacteria bacterium]|nr:NADH-quinone oxidoreductase subunit M [Actinomycetota bacterium]
GFAVKVPMFPFHTWLPDAHTQAPTQGSVILAAILLKLGTYGFIRIAIPMLPDAAIEWAPWIGGLAVVGIIYGALGCLAQTDMKRLIAFSSVAHMGFVQRTAFGTPKGHDHHDLHDVNTYEWIAWLPLLIAIVVFGVAPNLLFSVIDPAVQGALRAFGG